MARRSRALSASQSWSAWFGSIDASNFITVDKPPLSTAPRRPRRTPDRTTEGPVMMAR
jgi:hypothetical protein